jgi:hypothetical protein
MLAEIEKAAKSVVSRVKGTRHPAEVLSSLLPQVRHSLTVYDTVVATHQRSIDMSDYDRHVAQRRKEHEENPCPATHEKVFLALAIQKERSGQVRTLAYIDLPSQWINVDPSAPQKIISAVRAKIDVIEQSLTAAAVEEDQKELCQKGDFKGATNLIASRKSHLEIWRDHLKNIDRNQSDVRLDRGDDPAPPAGFSHARAAVTAQKLLDAAKALVQPDIELRGCYRNRKDGGAWRLTSAAHDPLYDRGHTLVSVDGSKSWSGSKKDFEEQFTVIL